MYIIRLKLFLFIISIISPAILSAQISVYPVDGTRSFADREGIFYALPRSVIKIDLKVKKYEKYKGPYAEYAKKFLDIENVIQSDRNEFEIVNATLSSVTEPDPDHYYFIDLTDRKDKNMLMLNLTELGLLQGYNSKITPSSLEEAHERYQNETVVHNNLFKYSTSSALYETTDTTIRKITMDTITVTKMYFEKIWLEKSDEKKAADAAKMIEEIRANKYNLLTGYQEVPYDGVSMAYMHKELQKLEDEYLSLFTGVIVEKDLEYSYTVLPVPGEENNMLPAFTFSERNGVHHATSPLGEIIYLNIEPLGLLHQVSEPLNMRESDTEEGKGLYYRIPEKAHVILEINNDLRLETDFLIPQFGVVTFLPPNVSIGGFDPETGNVSDVIIK